VETLADFEEPETRQGLVRKRMKYFKDYETCKTAWKNVKNLQDMTQRWLRENTWIRRLLIRRILHNINLYIAKLFNSSCFIHKLSV